MITDIVMTTGKLKTSAIELGMAEEHVNTPLRYEFKKAVQQVHACRQLKDKNAAAGGEKAARELLARSIARYEQKLAERKPKAAEAPAE